MEVSGALVIVFFFVFLLLVPMKCREVILIIFEVLADRHSHIVIY